MLGSYTRVFTVSDFGLIPVINSLAPTAVSSKFDTFAPVCLISFVYAYVYHTCAHPCALASFAYLPSYLRTNFGCPELRSYQVYFCFWNPESSKLLLWNPKSQASESGIQFPQTKYPDSGIHGVESRIQDCVGFSYTGDS